MTGNLEIGKFWQSLGHTCIGSMCFYKNVVCSEFRSYQFYDSSAWIGGPNDRKLELMSACPTTSSLTGYDYDWQILVSKSVIPHPLMGVQKQNVYCLFEFLCLLTV